MTWAAVRGMRKSFSLRGNLSTSVDDADDTDVGGREPKHPGAAAFEWPPADEVLSSQVIEFAREPLEGTRAPCEVEPTPESDTATGKSETAEGVDAEGMSIPVRHSSARPRRDARLARNACRCAGCLGSLRRPPFSQRSGRSHPVEEGANGWSRLRLRAVPAALVVLAVTAVTEGIFIFRTLRRPSEPISQRTTSIPRARANQSPAPATPVPSALRERYWERYRKDGQRVTVPAAPVVRAAVKAASGGRPSDMSPESGRLIIGSTPAGAKIVINGRYHGVTPKTLGSVAPGEYRIVLRRG